MKYTWEDSDVAPGVKVREKIDGSRFRYGEVEKIIAVGVGGGVMYQFGLYKEQGNFCSRPMDKKEMIEYLNARSYEPFSE